MDRQQECHDKILNWRIMMDKVIEVHENNIFRDEHSTTRIKTFVTLMMMRHTQVHTRT
jgi:hypothetical protein